MTGVGIYLCTILCVSWLTGVECLDQSQRTVLYAVLGLVGGLVTLALFLVCVCVCYQIQMEAIRNVTSRELKTKCDSRTKVKTIGLEQGDFNIHQAMAFFNAPQQYPGNSFFMRSPDEPDTFVLPTTQPNTSFMSPCNTKHQHKKKKKKTLKDLAVKRSKVAATNIVQGENDNPETARYELPVLPPLQMVLNSKNNGNTKYCTANDALSFIDKTSE